MERRDFILIGIFILFGACKAIGQNSEPADTFFNYNQYVIDLLQTQKTIIQNLPGVKTMNELQKNTASLMQERAPAQTVQTNGANKKPFVDEDIYSKRKNSVFILGKLIFKSDSSISFDLTGTAFAIASNGVCATNYHVLKDIIEVNAKQDSTGSTYFFIMTLDKKMFVLSEILAYSQNNDIAIFRVNTQDDQLKPIPLGKSARVGATVYCISHPSTYFYSFSKGIVSRNVIIDSAGAAAGYNKNGKPPIRMEITADYAVGSSGGPILDKYGNLIGMVSSTNTLYSPMMMQPQMVVKQASTIQAITRLLTK